MDNINREINETHMTFEVSKRTQDKTIIIENNGTKKYVVSKYDPREGVKKLIQKDQVNKRTLWIVMGFVLGYVIDEIVHLAGENAHMIVIEPNADILSEQLKLIQTERFKNMPHLSIFAGTDFTELGNIYKSQADVATYYNTYLVVNNAYNIFYEHYYNAVVDTIGTIRGELLVNKNTLNDRADTILANVVKNRKHIQKTCAITFHKNKYKDIPALIVSAGPSLNKNIEYIKSFKGLIFSGGRTLTPILEQGVNPDFVVSIDSEEFTYDTFKGKAENNFPLITFPGGSSKVVKSNKGPQYFVDSVITLGKQILNIDLEVMSTGGSVATLALKAAHYMGCNPIIFIGQDLAYTDMKTHSDSAAVGVQEINRDGKYLDADYMEVKAYHGGTILSWIAYVIFLKWFQEYIAEHPDAQYINATEGGACIEGTIQQPFKEVVEAYKHIVKPSIIHIPQQINPTEEIDNIFKESIKELRVINELAIKGESLSAKLMEEYITYKGIRHNDIMRILKKLEKEVDDKLNEFKDKGPFRMMFSSVYNTIEMDFKYQAPLNETALEEGLRVSELGCKLYGNLDVASKNMINIIEDGMKE